MAAGLSWTGFSPQFAPQMPPWMRAPRLPTLPNFGQRFGAQPAGPNDSTGPMMGAAAPASAATPAPATPSAPPGWGEVGPWTGLGNPFTGSNDIHTAPSIGIDALIAASRAGFYNPNQDPITEMLRTQGLADNAARANAGQLAARLQGGGDPYLQAWAALQSHLGGESDLSRTLGQSALESTQRNQDFYRQILMALLGSNLNTIGSDFLNRHQGQQIAAQDLGAIGGIVGAGLGALGGHH